jgi:hypothetical protein
MRMRSLLCLSVLTAAIVWNTSIEAQPGPGSGSDVKRLEAEIQKLKAALEDAEARLAKAKQSAKAAPTESDRLLAELKKLIDKGGKDGERKGPEGKGGFGPGGFGKGWMGKDGWGKDGWWGKDGRGKAPESEADRLLAELKKLLDKGGKDGDRKGPEGRGFDKGGFRGFEKGKAPPSENEKLLEALKGLLEKKGAPKAEASKGVEQRLDALQKQLDELRRELRKR